jgi:molybdopterin converting factor small subunit
MVEVRLFATLRKDREKVYFFEPDEIGSGAEALRRLGIADEEVKIYLINGHHSALDDPIGEGDIVSVFPAVGGG